MSKKIKKILLPLLSFFIPFIIIGIIFYIKGYFTDKLIISSDLRAQYYPLFGYLKDVFDGTNSIFYSFNKGVGGTMFGTFFYYVSSPLNLFLTLVSKNNIIYFITVLIMIKISLCGLTMYVYMTKKYKERNLKILIFSICYALMGYNINYFMNIMWLDVVYLAPLVLLGIDLIIKKDKPILYSTTLFISIFSNYYIAYMLCIFCVLYFLYEIFNKYDYKTDKRIILKKIKIFLISSLLTGLMCCFFIIPCVLESTNYGRMISFNKIFTFDYNFFDLFSKSYIGSLDLKNILNYTSMNLYCSEFFLVALSMYILSKTDNKKKKKLSLLLILIMILPTFIGVLNWIWHLLTIPTYLSYRYSFLLCLFIIRICYEEFENIEVNKKNILPFLILYLIISFYLIIITNIGNYYEFLNYKLILISIAYVLIYIILLFYKNTHKNINNIILIVILSELVLNIYIVFITASPLEKTIIDNYKEPMNSFSNYNDINYRIETTFFETMNESLLYKYNGVGNFLSTTNSRIVQFSFYAGNNEYTEYANYYTYQKQNYILDTLLGIQYTLYPNKINNYELIEKYKINDSEAYLYKNNYNFGYGYVIKNKCNDLNLTKFYDNEIYNCIFQKNNTFYKEYEAFEITDNTVRYKVKENEYAYIWIDGLSEEENKQFELQNKSLFENLVYSTERYLEVQPKSKTLEINIPNNIDIEKIKVYYFDYEKYKSQEAPTKIKITSTENNKLMGEIILENQEIAMITLPYEKGFIIKVDDKKTDYYEVLNTFIGIDISKGYHKISIEYKQPGLKTGIIISIIAMVLNIIYNYSMYKKKLHNFILNKQKIN